MTASRRALGLLRQAASEVGAATLAGEDTAPLVRRQRALEAEIRRRSHVAGRPHRTAGAGAGAGGDRPRLATAKAVREALGPERCLVEIAARGDGLVAVVVTERRARLVALGSRSEAERERSALLFALGRLARRRGGGQVLRAALASLHRARIHLDQLLLAPLAAQIGNRELVLVPSGELHALAWSLLPSAGGRPLTIAPSATQWLERQSRPRRRAAPATALVAGPGVGGAAAEVVRVRDAFYPTADLIASDDATSARVGAALERADLVHVAAHGEFRADNPLFSCLVLADGPLTVYDMEGLRGAPACLVLSACDAGLSTAPHGGEPMGPMAALLGIGTRSLVASVAPVPDQGATDFMLAFHERLAAGGTPSHALAGAQEAVIGGALVAERVEEGDPAVLAAVAASGYLCFGAG